MMDEVHLMIEERGIRFLLTGSSARALKRGGVNMLGGRGSNRVMHPFSWSEIRDRFSLDRALNHGLLPPHYLSDDPDEGLASYVDRYLTEEIAAEGLARSLAGEHGGDGSSRSRCPAQPTTCRAAGAPRW